MSLSRSPLIAARRGMWGFLLFAGVAWLAIGWSVLRLDPGDVARSGGLVLLFGALTEAVRALAGTKAWWLNAGMAALFTVTGAVLLADRDSTFTTPAALVGWYLMVRGAADVAVSMMTRETDRIWGLLMVVGVLEATVGFFAAGPYARTGDTVVVVLGALGLLRGVADLVAALRLHEVSASRAEILELSPERADGLAGYSAGLTDYEAVPARGGPRHRASSRTMAGSAVVAPSAVAPSAVAPCAVGAGRDGSGSRTSIQQARQLGSGATPAASGDAAVATGRGDTAVPVGLGDGAVPTGPGDTAVPVGLGEGAVPTSQGDGAASASQGDGAAPAGSGTAGTAVGRGSGTVPGRGAGGGGSAVTAGAAASGSAGAASGDSFHDEVLRTTADLDAMLALAGVTGAGMASHLGDLDMPKVPDTPEGVEAPRAVPAADGTESHGPAGPHGPDESRQLAESARPADETAKRGATADTANGSISTAGRLAD